MPKPMKVWLTRYGVDADIKIWPVKPTKIIDEYNEVCWVRNKESVDHGPMLACRRHMLRLLRGSGKRLPKAGQIVEIEVAVR